MSDLYTDKMLNIINRAENNEADPVEFGQYLKSLRKNKDLTLTELAERMGFTNPYLSQIENGKKGIPSADFLFKVAKALNMPPYEILYKAGLLSKEHAETLMSYSMSDPLNASVENIMEFAELKAKELEQKEIVKELVEQGFTNNEDANVVYAVEDIFTDEQLLDYKGDYLTIEEKREILNYVDYLHQKKKQNESKS